MSRLKGTRATVPLIVVGAAMLGIFWFRTIGPEYVKSLQEESALASAEGRQFGLSVNYRGCLDEATRASEACGTGNVFCESNARVFLGACMQTAKDVEAFCASLPRHDDRLARLSRAVDTCQELKRSGERCARVADEAAVFCEKRRIRPTAEAAG